MNMPCGNTAAEFEYDRRNQVNELSESQIAVEQMKQVQELAKSFLKGFTLTDTRRVNVFEGPTRVVKLMTITFGMRQVNDLVSERITEALCLGLYNDTEQSRFDIQKIIGDAAHEVAFEALDLESNPFVDLNDLKDALESL